MDQTLVASMRKTLEDKPTEELRQALERQDGSTSPETREAMRQILQERRTRSLRFTIAIGAAIILGVVAGAGAWWQGQSGEMIVLFGVGCAILGAASCYIPGLFGQG